MKRLIIRSPFAILAANRFHGGVQQIREAKEHVHLSQAALARYLNVTVGFVSQLARGTKEAKGPLRALLNVIRPEASRRSNEGQELKVR